MEKASAGEQVQGEKEGNGGGVFSVCTYEIIKE